MSNNPKYTEAYTMLLDDGLFIQDAIERDEPIFHKIDEFKLRRIYTYIKMFKVMHKMIDDDLTYIKKFDILFDVLFEKYCILALDREWTTKDFLGVQTAIKNIRRINDRWTEYYEIINQEEQPINDSDSETYEEIKEEINQKVYTKYHEQQDRINLKTNLRPFITPYNIQKESERRTDILNEINEDNEITTKKVIDISEQKQNIEIIIKMKTKTITISINE
jgi:hypothetical protein